MSDNKSNACHLSTKMSVMHIAQKLSQINFHYQFYPELHPAVAVLTYDIYAYAYAQI